MSTDQDLDMLRSLIRQSDGGRLPQRGHVWLALGQLEEVRWVRITRSKNYLRVALTREGRGHIIRPGALRLLRPLPSPAQVSRWLEDGDRYAEERRVEAMTAKGLDPFASRAPSPEAGA